MLKNYITVALRNLVRHKFFSIINIFGLAMSMTIAMAVIMLVADQMSYDRFNTRRDRIYRVTSGYVNNDGSPGDEPHTTTSCAPLRQELLEKYTGVEEAVRFVRNFGNGWLEVENQNVNVPLGGYFTDPEALTFFEYELEYGDAATALRAPYSVVLTRQAADKLFKEENPVGRTVKVGAIGTYTVTGVIKKTDRKTHVAFEALASMSTIESLQAQGIFDRGQSEWSNFWNTWTYIRLEPGKDPAEIKASLDRIYRDHIQYPANPEATRMCFHLQRLTDITLSNLLNNPIGPSLPWMFVYCFAGLAGVILLTSCFNFTNLSIARSLTRAREIGVRKVLGATRVQVAGLLIGQFLRPVAVACLVAWPLAYWMLRRWLAQFDDPVAVGPLVFVAGAAAAIAIGLIAVGGLAWSAASAEPGKALRHD